jgi:type VI secretion system protein
MSHFIVKPAGAGFLLVSLVLALSCGAAAATRSLFGGRLPFQVAIASDANNDSAVAVDVVVVYDAKLADELLKVRAADWFDPKQKTQFLKDHARQIKVQGWEWVPAQRVGDLSVPYEAGARKVIVFADYLTEGDHRAAVDPQQRFKLVLGKFDFSVEAP